MCYDSQIKEVQPQLKGFVQSRIFRSCDADDIIQNTNVILINKRSQYDENKNFKAWVFAIASFQIKAYLTDIKRNKFIYCNDANYADYALLENGRVNNSPLDHDRSHESSLFIPFIENIINMEPSPPDFMQAKEKAKNLIQKINLSRKKMSHAERGVFDLASLNYKNKDIAKILNIPVSSVSVSKYRAIEKIKKQLL